MKEVEIQGEDAELEIRDGVVVGRRAAGRLQKAEIGKRYRRGDMARDMARYFENKEEAKRFVQYYSEELAKDVACSSRCCIFRLGETTCEDSVGIIGAGLAKKGIEGVEKRRVKFTLRPWARERIRGQKNMRYDRGSQ